MSTQTIEQELFRMGGAALREASVGRTKRAKLAKAEIARRKAKAEAKKAESNASA